MLKTYFHTCHHLVNGVLISGQLLNKCPGVHPIGIGKALCQILGKVVAMITCLDIEKICSIDQLYSGLCSRLEGAIYAVCELFDEHCNHGWGLLLVMMLLMTLIQLIE